MTRKQIGSLIYISHGSRKTPNGPRSSCSGDVARVIESHPRTFLAECLCGSRFCCGQEDGYRAPTEYEVQCATKAYGKI